MGSTACTEPRCLYKGALYLYLLVFIIYSRRVYCEVGTKIYTSLRQNSGFAGTTFRPTTSGMSAWNSLIGVIEISDILELRPAFSTGPTQNTRLFSPFHMKTEADRTRETLWAFSPKSFENAQNFSRDSDQILSPEPYRYSTIFIALKLRRQLLLVLLIKKAGAKAKFFSTTPRAAAEQFDWIYNYVFRGSHDDKIWTECGGLSAGGRYEVNVTRTEPTVFTTQQATKAQRGSSSIALLFV